MEFNFFRIIKAGMCEEASAVLEDKEWAVFLSVCESWLFLKFSAIKQIFVPD